MQKTLVSFDQIPQLSRTDLAYAQGDPALEPFYRWKPAVESFADVIAARRAGRPVDRATLVEVLKEQYAALPERGRIRANIEALGEDGTFTVCTAHQPSLFLGPLYFLYKAISTINLAEAIERQTGVRIVPVFVLGSEDHDLAELNNVQLFGKTIVWEPYEGGAVGQMHAASVRPALDELRGLLGGSEAADALFGRVERAYSGATTFAEATQALLHEFLGRFGLVVLNPTHPALKRQFAEVVKAELREQPSQRIVNATLAEIQARGFKPQAAPREINLFYLAPGQRERIVLEDGVYKVLNTDLEFSAEEILKKVDEHPERFSPNVVLRPVYQEMILPNLAYVGGGGELAYWLERMPLFAHFDVPFPMLVRRNSALWLDREAARKAARFGFAPAEWFLDAEQLVRAYVEARAATTVDLSAESAALGSIFDQLAVKATAIDPTLEKAVRAEETKQRGVLEHWQSRLLRAEKQKHEVVLNQIRSFKEKYFPAGGLQERTDNFLPFVLRHGDEFLDILKETLDPLEAQFVVLEG
jgi:bacillithiol biosynthesis cysteine-adding enzyme BshC